MVSTLMYDYLYMMIDSLPLLFLVCMHNYDVITRRTVFRNIDQQATCSTLLLNSNSKSYHCGSSKVLGKVSSMTIDFEAEPHPFHLIQLSGR